MQLHHKHVKTKSEKNNWISKWYSFNLHKRCSVCHLSAYVASEQDFAMSKKTLYQIVKQAIDELDFYGLLKQGAPKEEFEDEALLISERLTGNDSIENIASIIADVFNEAFNEHRYASEYTPTAEKISQFLKGDLADIHFLGTKDNHGWVAVGYDIQQRYGYDTMLFLLNKFISKYSIKVERIAKAQVAGMPHTIVWTKNLFNKAPSLSQIEALKEECGEIAVGGVSKRLSDIHLYVSLINQTSIIYIQVPKNQYSDSIQRKLDIAIQYIQDSLLSFYR